MHGAYSRAEHTYVRNAVPTGRVHLGDSGRNRNHNRLETTSSGAGRKIGPYEHMHFRHTAVLKSHSWLVGTW